MSEYEQMTPVTQALLDLIEAAETVIDNWESGDLAGAVNMLRITAEDTRQVLEEERRKHSNERI